MEEETKAPLPVLPTVELGQTQRNISQMCELVLHEGVAYKKDGPNFIQRLVAKQKLRNEVEPLCALLLGTRKYEKVQKSMLLPSFFR